MSAPPANPLGLEGFAFIEFTADEPAALDRLFAQLGFAPVAMHRSRAIRHHAQGGASFFVNCEPGGHAARFRAAHGVSASACGLRVADAAAAFETAVARGALRLDPAGLAYDLPAIEGVGGSILYLADRDGLARLHNGHFEPVADIDHAADAGLTAIDHIAQNFHPGGVARWAAFYARVFGLGETRRFDIRGQHTGLTSRAMAGGGVRIPLNESPEPHSQIGEFLSAHRGEGIQHIALATSDICASVDALRARGVDFQETPDSYYDALEDRLPGHGEDVAALRRRGILIDGSARGEHGLLLQIFTTSQIGPIFFELIERRGNDGFGEGNITALFESIERDQLKRNAIPALIDD